MPLTDLEQRIAALEGRKLDVSDLPMAGLLRKIEQLGLDGSTMQSLPLGGFFAVFDAAISAAAPAGPTSGVALNVPRAGLYLCTFSASGFVAATGGATVTHFIDAVQYAVQSHLFNQTGVHMTIPPRHALVSLSAGPHYWYEQASAGLSTDGNDRSSIAAVRVG